MTAPFSRTAIPLYAETQGFLVITKAPVAGQAYVGKRLIEAGAINVVGDYECKFAVDGMNVIEAELMPSAVSGTFAPTLRVMRMVGDFGSNRSNQADVGANFSAGTTEVLTVTDMRGKRIAKVTFAVPGGGSVTFAPGSDPSTPTAVAEFNGL
jgi:hypothetical protein